jgi:CheY-like chemotaxis protein/two-component sensor histidine kinase
MEAVGRLTAGVAHDFNNLLQALGGSLELVQDEVADRPLALEYAQIAQRAAMRGRELTNRLLAFSRQQVLVTRAVQIRKLLGDVEPLIGHLFDGGTEIIVLPGPLDLAVMADAAQLETAIINLAVNSRDAMGAGGRLRVSAFEAEADAAMALPPGRYTVIAVTDNGAGMDEATIAQACEPFFSTKGLNGSGLGLSMVQGFARQSGGDLSIASALGRGTTIEIWLPSATMPRQASAPYVEAQRMRGRVLVVDDAPDVLLTVGAFLRQAGLEVTRVENGDLAIARLLAGERFDAVVTDFAMPGLNGLDLLTQARELDPAMAGLIITGFSDPDLLRGLDKTLVLRKPFSRSELIAQINLLVGADQRA